jgi:hypothetical protein
MGTVATPKVQHRPELVHRHDGRYEIRCRECERMVLEARPIGIGLPITSRLEAESIVRNHSVWAT